MDQIVNLSDHPIDTPEYRATAKALFQKDGVLVLPKFVSDRAIQKIEQDGDATRDKVFAQTSEHSVYLDAADPNYPSDHPRNRKVVSSKGCLTDDQIPETSPLRMLYNSESFRNFLIEVLGEDGMFPYADPLSSINLHFAETGQELGWHFDNSSFAITLMIQPAEKGGVFEYLEDLRDADAGEMNFEGVRAVLESETPVKSIAADAGTLVVFRGRNSIHRVTPNEGSRTRMLAVLAYNSEPGVSLSKEARRTFYGRTGEGA